MLLKNLMEDKQLDLNQPFLSVRRFSSTVSAVKGYKRRTDNSLPSLPPLPSYKSELKSGPVRNAGAVPFRWEQTPGRPKDEGKRQIQALEQPPTAPKLPPGRILKVKQQAPDKVAEDPSVISRKAGKVPCISKSVSSIDENLTKFQSSKDAVKEESSDSGDGDEAYLDALDTLSRTESFFLNCSLSGLSGLYDPDVEPSGTFSADPQTRDFMMGRFLPAAKAMASEVPQYASRKQPVVWEQPRQVKKVLAEEKRPPTYRYRPNILPNYDKDNKEEESDDEDDYDETRNVTARVCGLLPRFCLKSSFCLLNPVPGMSVRTRVPMSPASRMQARSSSTGSCSETDNEHSQVGTYEQRSIGGPRTAVLREDKKNMMKSESNQITYPSNSQKLEGSSLYRRLQGSGISPYQSELPQLPFYEERGFLGIPEEAKSAGINGFNSHKKSPTSFRELLADQSTEWEIGAASPLVEKTVYVDSVHKVESPNPNSFSSGMKGLAKSRENDLEIIANIRETEETPSVDSSLKDIDKLNIVDEEAILQPKILKLADSGPLSFPDKEVEALEMDVAKGFKHDKDVLHWESVTSANSKLPHNRNLDFEDEQCPKVENVENSYGSYSEFHLPPPLPKSPSESWLHRTLPSMSSKNPSSRSRLGAGINPRNQAAKTSTVDPKWETIVRTTKVQHRNLQFSEELITPAPET
ncbi:uncharacterized protein LOC132308962 [Cornus florida]|uniref:uncharacterized protein LOC132308962 n=1 Tax=Cornus florida TaxID=4283 RepID=UPI0028A0145A|nr:uncharacterized protein LOC132308962 [Cornus florida]XP_059663258.1 uncharacterized protein LOC132308962 [Cornus florida]